LPEPAELGNPLLGASAVNAHEFVADLKWISSRRQQRAVNLLDQHPAVVNIDQETHVGGE
jgi:hypothetical protein